jgi:hypothetical protein
MPVPARFAAASNSRAAVRGGNGHDERVNGARVLRMASCWCSACSLESARSFFLASRSRARNSIHLSCQVFLMVLLSGRGIDILQACSRISNSVRTDDKMNSLTAIMSAEAPRATTGRKGGLPYHVHVIYYPSQIR